MIDVHSHMEQEVYDSDRDDVLSRCKKEMKAVITCDPNPDTFKKTFSIADRYKGFVFAVIGIHPEYVERFSDDDIETVIETIKANRERIVGIGETGLDYHYIEDAEMRDRQREMFRKLVRLAGKMRMPVCVHIRNGKDSEENDAFEHAVEVLEQESANKVHLHMFGSRNLLKGVIDNGWYISENAIILQSKNYKKVVRDAPIDRLMVETDAPWLHPSGNTEERNDPLGVKAVIEKVAEVKKLEFDEVIERTTENATSFYELF